MVLLADRPIATAEELTPAQAATLSLLVRHGQSYNDVAGRLGSDATDVRARAHAALAALAGPSPHGSWDGQLIDQVLGQLPDPAHETPPEQLEAAEQTTQRTLLAAAVVRFGGPPRLEDGGAASRQRTPAAMIPPRIRVMFSVGVGLLVLGAILFLGGAH